jgi:hypothetical protein
MARKRHPVPSPAMIVALVALFVALAGAAYAVTLPKNSVKAKQIAKNAVRSKEIKNDQVKGVDVRNGGLGRGDISAVTGSFSLDATTIDAHSCSVNDAPDVDAPGVRGDDDIVLFPAPNTNVYGGNGGLIAFAQAGGGEDGRILVRICNVETGDISPGPVTFRYLAIR